MNIKSSLCRRIAAHVFSNAENRNIGLLLFAYLDYINGMKVLLEIGADIHYKNESGNTPLITAAFHGKPDTVKVALEANADVNAQNTEGETALIAVLRYQSEKPDITAKVVDLLLKANADPNRRDSRDNTALYYASERNFEAAKLLLEIPGIDLNAGEEAPIFCAFRHQKFDVVELLIQKGAEINIKDRFGDSILTYAVKANNPVIVEALIKAGADCDAKGFLSKTPREIAVSMKNSRIISLFPKLKHSPPSQNPSFERSFSSFIVDGSSAFNPN